METALSGKQVIQLEDIYLVCGWLSERCWMPAEWNMNVGEWWIDTYQASCELHCTY